MFFDFPKDEIACLWWKELEKNNILTFWSCKFFWFLEKKNPKIDQKCRNSCAILKFKINLSDMGFDRPTFVPKVHLAAQNDRTKIDDMPKIHEKKTTKNRPFSPKCPIYFFERLTRFLRFGARLFWVRNVLKIQTFFSFVKIFYLITNITVISFSLKTMWNVSIVNVIEKKQFEQKSYLIGLGILMVQVLELGHLLVALKQIQKNHQGISSDLSPLLRSNFPKNKGGEVFLKGDKFDDIPWCINFTNFQI